MKNSPTAAQDRVPFIQKFAYGFGSLTNNLLSGAFGAMAIVLNLGLGMNPATIGWLTASARLTDAFLDPIMGYLSDNTRTRWGRRRPYIVIGAIASGIFFALMWQITAGKSQSFYFWFFLIGLNLFYVAFALYAAPLIALGYEMTADYNERTRIQAYSNLLGQVPWLTLSWCYAFMQNRRWFDSDVEGARALAILVGAIVVVCGMLPGLFCREPFYAIVTRQDEVKRAAGDGALIHGLRRHVGSFFSGFGVTLRNKQFLKLAAATFLAFNGFMLIAGLGSYVILFYMFPGEHARGAAYIGAFGTTLSACTFGAIMIVSWLATHIGKKKAFLVSTSIAIVGYVLKFFCYQPGQPWLMFVPAPLLSFGLGGLFVTVSAMIADVCDMDELENGTRREGMFGAVYWWMVKLGTAAALVLGGYLLNGTGFDQAVGDNQPARTLFLMRAFECGIPIVLYATAMLAIFTYDLSPEKAHDIRRQLEARRGTAA